jgi:hypothetical protein
VDDPYQGSSPGSTRTPNKHRRRSRCHKTSARGHQGYGRNQKESVAKETLTCLALPLYRYALLLAQPSIQLGTLPRRNHPSIQRPPTRHSKETVVSNPPCQVRTTTRSMSRMQPRDVPANTSPALLNNSTSHGLLVGLENTRSTTPQALLNKTARILRRTNQADVYLSLGPLQPQVSGYPHEDCTPGQTTLTQEGDTQMRLLPRFTLC